MTEHSIVIIECPECSQINTVTHLEHPRDSRQHGAVCDGHDRLAAEHHKQTGHNPNVVRYSGTPAEMVERAQFHATFIDGVDADSFSSLEANA